MGSDYSQSQLLSSRLFDNCFDGIAYRVKRDPLMELEAVALFRSYSDEQIRAPLLTWGEPEVIGEDLRQAGHEFDLVVQPRPPGRDG